MLRPIRRPRRFPDLNLFSYLKLWVVCRYDEVSVVGAIAATPAFETPRQSATNSAAS